MAGGSLWRKARAWGLNMLAPRIRQALSRVAAPVGETVALIPMGSLAQWGLTAGS